MEVKADGFDAVLEHLKSARGFDFTGYKRSSIERRLRKRMEAIAIGSFMEYLDYLEVHPDEFAALFNTMLINVTGFFRDPEAWEYLASDIVPRIIEGKEPDAPIRVWSAGCASGEEPFSVAMLFADALGIEDHGRRVKIYATDVDEETLDEARHGVYTDKHLESVSDERRTRYFDRVDQRWAFRKDLRRTVIFGRNDLVQDAPISRVDLLVCRNTLMYFNAETQSHVLRRFHFALQPTGFLFLGKSEMLLTRGELFLPVNLKRRVFAKVADAKNQERRAMMPHPGFEAKLGAAADDVLRQHAFDAAPVAQLVVDRTRTLVMANHAARRLLGIHHADVGRPLKDLEVSYRPSELRGALDAAFDGDRHVAQGPVAHTIAGDERLFDVRLEPLHVAGRLDAVSVTYVDLTAERRKEQELERSKSELGAAYEELQSTVEELETTNEELQSTNEELETTNEELQSTNEELETMNEELQSSNEEMETTNDELRQRSFELNEANAFMETILTTMGVGVIVVDRDQRVRIWNSSSEDLWGLRRDEATGAHILGLDIGLPVEQLRSPLRDALQGAAPAEPLQVDATDRRGRAFRCEVSVASLSVDNGDVTAAILLTKRSDGRPAA